MFGFVASQLAAIPHAHAGLSPAEQLEHSHHPHVHVGGCSHPHEHNCTPLHSHDHERVPQPAPARTPLPCHDAAAIYLPTGSEWASLPLQEQVKKDRAAGPVTTADDVASLCNEFESRFCSLHPPDSPPGGSKIFLKLRSLRI